VTDFTEILQCITCGGRITRDGEAYSCAVCGPFPNSGGQPVLVDFGDSILDRATLLQRHGATPVKRRASSALLKRILVGRNRAATRGVDLFLGRLPRSARILIIGSGTIGSGAERLYGSEFDLIGLDIYASEHTNLIADAHKLPFAPDSFDGVWIQAVLEHVLEPRRVVAEIWRVLKPGRLVFADTPLMQPVHEGAYDFTRFTRSGHRWLFRRFEEMESGATAGAGTALMWSIRYFVRAVTRSDFLAQLAGAAFFWLRFLDGASREHEDAASGVYFIGAKADRPLEPTDVVDYYERGGDRLAEGVRPR
jgi:SAM-dependent methyltransferase